MTTNSGKTKEERDEQSKKTLKIMGCFSLAATFVSGGMLTYRVAQDHSLPLPEIVLLSFGLGVPLARLGIFLEKLGEGKGATKFWGAISIAILGAAFYLLVVFLFGYYGASSAGT